MEANTLFVMFVILIAFSFDFTNGFHDAANSIATIVTTGVLTTGQAVIWAAFFNFIAIFIFKLMVAKTIGYGLIDTSIVDVKLIFAALIGAILWNLITWYYKFPSSSSQALIGGLIGAAIVKGGFSVLKFIGVAKVLVGIFVSPVLGMLIGLLIAFLLGFIIKKHSINKVNNLFKYAQLASSAFLSLTHGGNDAQKTIGIIALLLVSMEPANTAFNIPFWVIISCYLLISLGTLFGGWRIVQTMGTKITRLNPLRGCAAETGAAIIIFIATQNGIPVSTTHTVTGSIAGVGLVDGVHGTNWTIIKQIFLTWLSTMPAAGLIAAAVMITV